MEWVLRLSICYLRFHIKLGSLGKDRSNIPQLRTSGDGRTRHCVLHRLRWTKGQIAKANWTLCPQRNRITSVTEQKYPYFQDFMFGWKAVMDSAHFNQGRRIPQSGAKLELPQDPHNRTVLSLLL